MMRNNKTNNGVKMPSNKSTQGRPTPMMPRAGVTRTRRRYGNGGKAE